MKEAAGKRQLRNFDTSVNSEHSVPVPVSSSLASFARYTLTLFSKTMMLHVQMVSLESRHYCLVLDKVNGDSVVLARGSELI